MTGDRGRGTASGEPNGAVSSEDSAQAPSAPGRSGTGRIVRKLLAGLAAIGLVAAAYWLFWRTGALALVMDAEALRGFVERIGLLGPLAIVGLLALAIVVSPIPSAPIALAAGAAYGHVWGTLFVLLGAELGALVAFFVARLVGYEIVKKWFGERLSLGAAGSQNALMAIVFATRLMPFVSFDIVSYAAGLTPLSVWRFALATLAGIVPASFLLAHFGEEMVSADARRIGLAALALGVVVLLPVVVRMVLRWRAERRTRRPPAGAG